MWRQGRGMLGSSVFFSMVQNCLNKVGSFSIIGYHNQKFALRQIMIMIKTQKGIRNMIHIIRNLKIRLKLYILIGVALIGMFMIGGMSFNLMGQMNEMTLDISTSWLPSIDTARDMSTSISNIRLNELGYLTAISADVEASSLQYLQKEKEDMAALLATYGELIDEEERAFYDNAMNLWIQYNEADEEMMALAGQGLIEEARAILEGECVDLYNSLNSSFDGIITYNSEGSDDAAE